MTASRLRVSAFDIPTDSTESDGTLEWDKTTLVTVELRRGGADGFGYTYADRPTAEFIVTHLAPIALAADPLAPQATFAAMGKAVRNVGRDGVGAMAIAAVDMACWDLKANTLGASFAGLLGCVRTEISAYGSGGFTSYSVEKLCEQLAAWKDDGFARVKMKIGHGPSTPDRMGAARRALGDSVELFVDANGAYDRKRALALAQRLTDYGVTWFEEPVSSDDLEGLSFLRERSPASVDIAAGEYGYRTVYFERMLSAHAVDVLQADATRCGVTGFLRAATLCTANHVSLSAHCAPTVHAHLGCVAEPTVHVEYFHDHARVERMLFDGACLPEAGRLRPDLSRPGLGVELKRADADRYLIFDKTEKAP